MGTGMSVLICCPKRTKVLLKLPGLPNDLTHQKNSAIADANWGFMAVVVVVSGADSESRGEGDICSGGCSGGGGGDSGCSNGLTGTFKDANTQEHDLASTLNLNGFENAAAVFIDEDFDARSFSMLTSANSIDINDIPQSRYGALPWVLFLSSLRSFAVWRNAVNTLAAR
jgi:hypothetical protein